MDKRSAGLIATVATVLLCGLPGLLSLCAGVLAATMSFLSPAEMGAFGREGPQNVLIGGLGLLCLGIIGVAIPVIVGIFTLRQRPEVRPEPVPEPVDEEPIPPPI